MAAPSKSVPQKDAPQTATHVHGRAERLAAALRENLKRRKAQARSQAERQSAERDPVDADRTGG